MKKVFVLGLDGADWYMINKWIDEGLLPNFKRLKENGVSRRIDTVMPPLTAPAWTSMFTGCDPSEHGILGMIKCNITKKKLEIYTLHDIKKDPIWRTLNRKGKRSIIIRFPLAYPVEEINGIMIGGFFAPSLNEKSVYPPSLLPKLRDYPLESGYNEGLILRIKGKHLECIKYYNTIFKKRIRIVKELMQNHAWDFFFVLVDESDRVLHLFADKEDIVLEHFKEIDKFVGYLLDNLDNNTVLIVVSDHGFCKVKKIFYVNSYLLENGYLRIPVRSRFAMEIKNMLKQLPESILRRALSKAVIEKHVIEDRLMNYLLSNSIAACISYGDAGIRLNPKLSPEERKYYKKRIISELNKLKDPETGERIIIAYDRNEIYKGRYRIRAPEILLLPINGYTISSDISKPYIEKPRFFNKWGDHLNYESMKNTTLFVYNYDDEKDVPSSIVGLRRLIINILQG